MALPSRHLLVVDRRIPCRVEHYKRRAFRSSWRLLDIYPASVGLIGQFDTPHGLYEVTTKAEDPDWRKPDSHWVPVEERGEVIPGGHPDNPLKGAFLSLWDRHSEYDPIAGIGLHGTAEVGMLGRDASHGCIRLSEAVIRRLFKAIPVGTPVYII